MIKSVDETLKERGKTYGSFEDYAKITNELKLIAHKYDASYLNEIHSEALDMIFSKIARIINGDPNHADSWHDIAGYAKLVENSIISGRCE